MDQIDRLLWENARAAARRFFIDPDGEVYSCARCGALLNELPIPEGPTRVYVDCPSCQKRSRG